MQNEKLKKVLKLGAIASFAIASMSIAETSFTSSIEAARIKELNSHNTVSPINKSFNYQYLKNFPIFKPELPNNYNIKIEEIMQMEPRMEFPKSLDNYMVPLVYTAESLDHLLDSIANFKKSPEEKAFDNAFSNVIKKKNLDSALIDKYLIKTSAWQESRFFPYAVSDKGAVGLMQFLKDTYLHFRPKDEFPKDAYIPENNLSAGIDYYTYLIDYIKDNHPRADTLSDKNIIDYAIVAYNAGPGAFTHTGSGKNRKLKPANKQWRNEFMPEQSRNHLTFVTDQMEVFKKRDALIEFAQEYQKRKAYIAANDDFYGRN